MTRRSALAGLAAAGAALALAGCTPKQTTSAAQLIAGDGLGPLYTEASRLVAQYDRALSDAPALVELFGPLREEHRQHLIALASLIGLAMPAISPGPHPSGIPLPPPHPTVSASSPATGSSTTASPGAPAPSSAATPPAVASGTTTPPPAGSASPPGLTPPASVVPSGSPSTGLSTAAIKAQLSAAEKIAQANAVAACLSVAADRVPIVAAIAACRATHVAALR
ncbi:MAG TPA: twin-arginine translocation signal domain-containing protein [Micromonosporaceae bacterium]|nr:twin-arginine translocation signal domain-containing protein [Micromonosporaceae bacterium]